MLSAVLAGVGVAVPIPAGAAVSPITVNVNSNTDANAHQEGVTDPSIAVGTFTDPQACSVPDQAASCLPGANYTVNVNWGDLSPQSNPTPVFVSVSGNAGTYSITSGHAFPDEFRSPGPGPSTSGWPINVGVTSAASGATGCGGPSCTPPTPAFIAVRDQPLVTSGGGITFAATAGVQFSGRQIGSFHDGNQLARKVEPFQGGNEFSFSILWGDGTPADTSTGDVVIPASCASNPPGIGTNQGCVVGVTGGHTYASGGTYTVKITPQDGQTPKPLPITSTANVTGAVAGACTSATLSTGAVSSPQPTDTAVTFTAGAAGCATPQFQFFVYSANTGAWTMVQSYSAATTWALNYSKMPSTGTYTVDVWARNLGSPNQYDSFGLMSWVVGGCNSASTAGAGTIFTTNANGVACGNPEYKTWITGNGRGWFVAHDWTSTNTFDTTTVTPALTPGTYTIDVWVRQHGTVLAANYYETWGLATYINGGACSTSKPTLLAAPGSPQPTGTTVNFTAAGCDVGAKYEYWLFPGAGNKWQMLQAYPTATYGWNTQAMGIMPGTYSIVAWAKTSASTTTTYDSYALYSYTLSGQTSASMVADKSNPQAAGTTVTFTVTAVGPGTAEYRFWVLPSGGTWIDAQAYSPTNTFAWTAGSANTYAIIVWVRTQNGGTSSGQFETYDAMSFSTT